MSKIPNNYKLTHIETGEVLEGTAKELAIKLNVTPKKISRAYYDECVMKIGYIVERIEQNNNSNVLEEWDRFMEGVRRKYGKKGKI